MRIAAGKIQFVGGFTSDFFSIVQGTLGGPWGRHAVAQPLFDALQDAATRFPKDNPLRRRAILVVSDDLENGSRTSIRAATETLLDAGISVYEIVTENVRHPYRESRIGFPTGKVVYFPPFPLRKEGESLAPICESTGGERFSTLLAGDSINAAFERLRQTYVLWFYATPGTEREFRTLTVRLAKKAVSAHPGAVLRFRTGFYYEPPFY